MMPNKIEKQIKTIRRAVFDGKSAEAIRLTTTLMEVLLRDESRYQPEWTEIFSIVLRALDHKDYLLAADVLLYEITDVYEKG